MCGRFALSPVVNNVEKLVPGIKSNLPDYSYNISPGTMISAIANDGELHLISAFWGIAFTHNGKSGFSINLRAESFNLPQRRSMKRLVIPATHYFEWKRPSAKIKIPYCVQMRNAEIFGLAGAAIINDAGTYNFSIITCEANSLIAPIHNRMPVMLDETTAAEYLDSGNEITDFLQPYTAEKLDCFEVSNYVNNAGNNSPNCIEPAKTAQLDSLQLFN